MTTYSHISVLQDEAVAELQPVDGGLYLDGTFGGGGYSRAILERAACSLYAIDRDPDAVARGDALSVAYPGRFEIMAGRIGELTNLLEARKVDALDGAVFDLGVSSYQIDDPSRGFSFRMDGPLDMRMGRDGRDAAEIVNLCPESDLADILFKYGDEKAARRIAKAVVERRKIQRFATTADLAGVIRSVVRPDKSGIDPATRSFQALRIAVNEELTDIEAALEQAAALLKPGGRLVVVSFHSLEDRIVKHFFAERAGRMPAASRHDPAGLALASAPLFKLVKKSPVLPGLAEIRANPRARSAKLRAIERLAA
ncbi:MAG: 16S rRNA (cytosine(1402)-N(4))-methyltransferase RsmH [Rhodospirillales bacterium]|nr:16S rRNA (cytosine(1402)-N(4))-methyltransferase RsmH [Rhodospirillales bacterium]MDE2319334.1 16S rRNA (cytosine(1402)-N(4))-methyltransferase RsmH [Rhodospirillales bacterium]